MQRQMMLAAAITLGVCATHAKDECGTPEAGKEIVCSPASYDADTDGNIVYFPTETDAGEVRVRLTEDLTVRYDRTDPDDDQTVFPDDGEPMPTAVRIETAAEHTGNVTVHSAADIVSNARGLSAAHYGRSGSIRTEVDGGTYQIDGEWVGAFAIHSYRGAELQPDGEAAGDVELIVRNVDADVKGGWVAVIGTQNTAGDLTMSVSASNINNTSKWATGIAAIHTGRGALDVKVEETTIGATGESHNDGVYTNHLGTGDSSLTVRKSNITVRTKGEQSNGIAARHARGAGGALNVHVEDTEIDIAGERGADNAETHANAGRYLDGLWAGFASEQGDIALSAKRSRISAAGADSGGISAVHETKGNIEIDVEDGTIDVEGDRSAGIEAEQNNNATGDIALHTRNVRVETHGESGAGIRAFNSTGEGTIEIRVDGGTIAAHGEGTSGISVGLTGRTSDEMPEPIEAVAETQEVWVNGHVRGGTGAGAGVRMQGSGQVEVGPEGSVGAASGVAIRAEGDDTRLEVNAQLDGRQWSEAVAGEIRNDEGRSTIAVNGVVLHDAMTGATGTAAPNGAWDVTLAASETIEGRAFRAEEFVTSFAPRAAVYEALPGYMLRLDEGGRRTRDADAPTWVRVSHGEGSYHPDRARVGATYQFNHFEVEAGRDFELSRQENLIGWAALRHLRGRAIVSAPTRGGRIEATGLGAALGAAWQGANDHYASGHLSVTGYETDLKTHGGGVLAKRIRVKAHAWRLEAGRRLTLSDSLTLTPYLWLTESKVSTSDFEDAVASRVSLRDGARRHIGAGVTTLTTQAWDEGERSIQLRAHAGAERALGPASTRTGVSGETLASEADPVRVAAGMSVMYQSGAWSVHGELVASGVGSRDNAYRAALRVGMRF